LAIAGASGTGRSRCKGKSANQRRHTEALVVTGVSGVRRSEIKEEEWPQAIPGDIRGGGDPAIPSLADPAGL